MTQTGAEENVAGIGYSGLPGLDKILGNIRLGDNVVLQVDQLRDYHSFVHPFCREARQQKRDLIYFRFADHAPVIPKDIPVHTIHLRTENGFENFIDEIFSIIEKFGRGTFYVFDSLSELAADWYSDRMLGNFFMLTCPYLYDYATVAYFALTRNRHTPYAVNAIHRTAQVVIDVYRHKESLYAHPLKVDRRHSNTMYMLHHWQGEEFRPVTSSSVVAEILTKVPQPWLDLGVERQDVWTRNFAGTKKILETLPPDKLATKKNHVLLRRLLRMAITREPRLFRLALAYLGLVDMAEIGKRMIGTGLIGGKSVGMLLARAILIKKDPAWREKLEPHDSFFIGSDVFYTFLIENQCWWMRRKLSADITNHALAAEARERILQGVFPADIEDQFVEMLNYFGQSPIIVRSSSLLEDAYGNAFSGKYESVFCANQGTPAERLEAFKGAVRKVYASTLSPEALAYRAHWGLLHHDEQMAILVQRVSGGVYGDQFFPQTSGVGFSFNPFVWNRKIDPEAGLIRLVFGLGTRAVDRVDDDYTRIVALNAPELLPDMSLKDIGKYTQHKVDILDLKENRHLSRSFADVVRRISDFPLEIFASRDQAMEKRARELHYKHVFPWTLTFSNLLATTSFVENMREALRTLQEAYDNPVDIEFTANFTSPEDYRINLLQCRPFQVKGNIRRAPAPQSVPREKIILESQGPVIGGNVATTVDRLIYVVPPVYGQLKTQDRHAVARVIGRLTQPGEGKQKPVILLVGPGRWATSMPELGVPVSLAEIHNVSILCEVAAMHEGLIPEVSLGTHFFNDLVEMDMLYFAVYPQKPGHLLNSGFFDQIPNALAKLSPEDSAWSDAVKVVDRSLSKGGGKIYLGSDVMKQTVLCYRE